MLSFTSSATPGSMKLTPKSERLIVVAASKPAAGVSRFGAVLLTVTSNTTGRVTPWMVRSPATFSLLPPAEVTFVLLKLAVGNCASSNMSGLRRCSSIFTTPVLTLEIGSCTSMLDFVGSLASKSKVPVTSVKRPLMFE